MGVWCVITLDEFYVSEAFYEVSEFNIHINVPSPVCYIHTYLLCVFEYILIYW